jgi:hypothetical protein
LEERFFDDVLRFFDDELRFFDDDRFFDVFVLPSEARSLFTVAAAMRFAVFVERPRFFALDLMCSYCRSSLLLHALGITLCSFHGEMPANRERN